MTTLTRIISIFYINVADLSKLRKLQRSARSLKSEKSAVVEEISSLLRKMAYKDKDLRKAKEELVEAQEDVSHLTEKLTEVRQQKVKFARLAREKGEEIGEGKGRL